MRLVHGITIAAAMALLAPAVGAQMQDMAKAVADGGIKVAGWAGQVDANEAKAGMTVNSAKFVAEGKGFHVTTGPAITYWNPANKAAGDYTVKATFTEPKFMNLMEHAHPYGVVIGINDAGTENMTALYCNAYGNGTFIVRGFGPAPFSVSPRRAEANAAINKAAGKDQPVTQEIALSVKGEKVECSVNGTVVGSYDKAAVVGAGKLKSTDGMFGVRFGHNTEAIVTNLAMSKN